MTGVPTAYVIEEAAKVPKRVRIGFGVGDFGFLLVWQGTALFLMYFYTDVLGISPAVAGSIYLAAMIWDAVTDPVIATLAERTRTRWGRYRPWLLFGALPFAVSYPLAFSPGPFSIEPWIWALVTHLSLRTAYTVVSMPFNALQARLTDDARERSVLAGFRMAGAASGGIAIVVLTPMIVGLFGPDNEARGYFAVAVIAGLLALFGLLFCFATMREPEETDPAPTRAPFFRELMEVFPMLVRNPPLIRVFLIIIIGSICIGMFSKNVIYHFKYDVQRPELTVWALLLPAVLLIITTPLWVWLSSHRSKRFALVVGLCIAMVGYLGFFLNPSDNTSVSFAFIALIGSGTAAVPVMFWAMLPDTVEYGEAETGIRAEARTFGFATFAQKAAAGINAALLGALLGAVGFVANSEQSASTLLGMKAIMALIPVAGVLAALYILRDYELDQAAHAELKQRIRTRRDSQVRASTR